MKSDRIALILKVDGMTCEGCSEAVRRAIRRIDPDADVSVDLAQGRVTAVTSAQSLEIAQALDKAGYTATAMTG